MASDGPSPHLHSLRPGLATHQPSQRHHAQPRVPARPLISWPMNASRSRIPSRASRASLPPRWWATTCSWLPLCTCTAPLSCSLQPLLKLSFQSLTISAPIYYNLFTLADSRKPDLVTCAYVCLLFPLLLLLFWYKWTSAFSPCLQLGCYHNKDSFIPFILVYFLGSIINIEQFWYLCCAFCV